jgi:hypothetical protein
MPKIGTGHLIGRTRGTAPLPRVHWPSAPNEQDDPACVVRVIRRPVMAVVAPVLSVPVSAPPNPSLGAKPLVAERFSGEMKMPEVVSEPEAETPTRSPRRRRVMFGAAIAMVSSVALAAGLFF